MSSVSHGRSRLACVYGYRYTIFSSASQSARRTVHQTVSVGRQCTLARARCARAKAGISGQVSMSVYDWHPAEFFTNTSISTMQTRALGEARVSPVKHIYMRLPRRAAAQGRVRGSVASNRVHPYIYAFFFRAMLCKRGLSSCGVCLVSVTFVNAMKTNKHIIKIFTIGWSNTLTGTP